MSMSVNPTPGSRLRLPESELICAGLIRLGSESDTTLLPALETAPTPESITIPVSFPTPVSTHVPESEPSPESTSAPKSTPLQSPPHQVSHLLAVCQPNQGAEPPYRINVNPRADIN